jgi:hypothetical protein
LLPDEQRTEVLDEAIIFSAKKIITVTGAA